MASWALNRWFGSLQPTVCFSPWGAVRRPPSDLTPIPESPSSLVRSRIPAPLEPAI